MPSVGQDIPSSIGQSYDYDAHCVFGKFHRLPGSAAQCLPGVGLMHFPSSYRRGGEVNFSIHPGFHPLQYYEMSSSAADMNGIPFRVSEYNLPQSQRLKSSESPLNSILCETPNCLDQWHGSTTVVIELYEQAGEDLFSQPLDQRIQHSRRTSRAFRSIRRCDYLWPRTNNSPN